MLISIKDPSPENQRLYPLDNKNITLTSICPMSYIVEADLTVGSNRCSLLIGRYSSLAYKISIDIGMDHLYRCITTYPPHKILPSGYHTTDASTINPAADPLVRHQMIIGSDVWIGANAQLLGSIHIGNGAVIGAGAVVAKDVPPYAVVVGNPARIIKYRFDEETITRLQRIKWWNWPKENIETFIPQFNDDMTGFLDRFDPGIQKEEYDETAAAVHELRAQGYHISYFIPDFEIPIPYCVWPRVIDSFLAAYTEQDKAALVIAMPHVEDVDAYANAIASRIAEAGERTPLILSHRCSAQMPFSVAALRASDTYITTREHIASVAVDYAADAGISIRYGLDHGALVFPPIKNENTAR